MVVLGWGENSNGLAGNFSWIFKGKPLMFNASQLFYSLEKFWCSDWRFICPNLFTREYKQHNNAKLSFRVLFNVSFTPLINKWKFPPLPTMQGQTHQIHTQPHQPSLNCIKNAKIQVFKTTASAQKTYLFSNNTEIFFLCFLYICIKFSGQHNSQLKYNQN